MSKEELRDLLEENLTVVITNYGEYDSSYPKVKVEIYYDNKLITEDSCSLMS